MPNYIRPDGTVRDERRVETDLPVEQFITALREAAKGLDNPRVEVETEHWGDGDTSTWVQVYGYRPATQVEKDAVAKAQRSHTIRQEALAKAALETEKRLREEGLV
jgi:hypothetical protein